MSEFLEEQGQTAKFMWEDFVNSPVCLSNRVQTNYREFQVQSWL